MLNNISDWLGMTSPSPETLAPSKSQQKLANVLADRHEDSEPAVNGAAVSEAADSIEQKLYGEPPLTFAPPSACRVSASTHAASSVQHHAPSLTPLHIQHQQYFVPRCAQIVFQISTSKFNTPPFFSRGTHRTPEGGGSRSACGASPDGSPGAARRVCTAAGS